MKINVFLINLVDNVSHDFDIISYSKYCNDVDFQVVLQETNCDIYIVNLNCL